MILASCRGMGAFQAMPGVIVTTSSTMKCCDGNCVRRWPLTSFGSYRPGPYPHKGKGVCVRDVCAIYDNNISPSLLMIIIKIIILYFIQIRHTDAFPPTGTLLVQLIDKDSTTIAFLLLFLNSLQTNRYYNHDRVESAKEIACEMSNVLSVT